MFRDISTEEEIKNWWNDILKRAVGHTPKSKTLDEVYLHLKANQMIEAFDKADQLVKDEVLALPEE